MNEMIFCTANLKTTRVLSVVQWLWRRIDAAYYISFSSSCDDLISKTKSEHGNQHRLNVIFLGHVPTSAGQREWFRVCVCWWCNRLLALVIVFVDWRAFVRTDKHTGMQILCVEVDLRSREAQFNIWSDVWPQAHEPRRVCLLHSSATNIRLKRSGTNNFNGRTQRTRHCIQKW